MVKSEELREPHRSIPGVPSFPPVPRPCSQFTGGFGRNSSLPHLVLAVAEAAARDRLTALAYEYYVGGANDEVTVRENRAAFERLALRYHVLVDVSRRSTATSVLGTR